VTVQDDFRERFAEKAEEAQRIRVALQEEIRQAQDERDARYRAIAERLRTRVAIIDQGQIPELKLDVKQEVSQQIRDAIDYRIIWSGTLPQRALYLRESPTTSRLWWTWLTGDRVKTTSVAPVSEEIDVRQFTPEQFDELILALADQAAWQDDHPPEINVPTLPRERHKRRPGAS
jgi:hypothetical protein